MNQKTIKKLSIEATNKNKNIITKNTNQLKNYIENLTEEQEQKFWIKTLLTTHSKIPEIIKAVDKIIELQATSVSFMSDIYNREKSTLNQVEKVIDLSERKNNLLNIYIMSKKLTKNLSFSDADFIEKKFVYNWTSEDLAKEFNISVRTVFRKIDKLISEIYETTKRNNWSLRFFKSQVKNERWLHEKFIKQVSEYFKLSNHNKSSSES